jgi:hypothetical protein
MNYTTYNLHHEQDSINPCTKANVMVLHPTGLSPNPYWYAQIIGIFHVMVDHPNLANGTWMDFPWVHWYGVDIDQAAHHSGFNA